MIDLLFRLRLEPEKKMVIGKLKGKPWGTPRKHICTRLNINGGRVSQNLPNIIFSSNESIISTAFAATTLHS